MKRKNTLWSLVLALVMVLGVFAPLSALADNANEPGKQSIAEGSISLTKPDRTTVNIHKLQADSYNVTHPGNDHDGGEIDTSKIGSNVRELDGVTFTYYKLKDAKQLNDLYAAWKKDSKAYSTEEKMAPIVAAGATKVDTITTKDKKGATVSLEDGFYWFIETGKPETVSSSIAVPFGISIPVMNKVAVEKAGKNYEPGTVYLSTVHVYPKNVTGDKPESKKTVANEVNVNASYEVGKQYTWFLHATVPANIADYTKFTLTDSFSKGLTYKGNVKVYLGYDGIAEGDKKALATSSYNLAEPDADHKFTDNDTQKLNVELTETGIKELASLYPDMAKKAGTNKVKLYVTVDTVINEDAKMGTKVPNEYDLTFTVGGKNDKSTSNKPDVETGGKKFIKESESEKDKPLQGAVFALYDGAKQMTWTKALVETNKAAIEAGKFAKDENGTKLTVADAEAAVKGTTPLNIYLMSIDDGTFEIKGLEYSKWTEKTLTGTEDHTHEYKVKEVKFPENYAGNKDTEYKFTVDAKSYDGTATAYEGETLKNGAMLILNKDLTIPPTGGIGTVIFVVAGMALMGGAFIAMRKRSAEQA